jgi:hypothetical protein
MPPLFKGSGGCVWDITPPEPGTMRRRQFDEQLASGELVPVEADPAPTPTPSPRKRAPKRSAEEA